MDMRNGLRDEGRSGRVTRRRVRRATIELMEGRTLLSGIPQLEPGVLLKNGTSTLAVNSDSTPEVADWDGDGKKDLLVGQYTNGNIWLYSNKGTDANPSFNGASQMLANGKPITTSYG